MTPMKNIITAILVSFTILLSSGNAHAGPATDYLREKIKEAQTGSPNWNIDYEEISKSALGDAWKTATKKQREDFLKAFSRVVKKSFEKHADEIKDLTVDFLWESSDNGVTTVTTKVKKKDETTDVTYKFKKVKDDFTILDVIVEGSSMVGNWRSQFKKTIERRGLDGLIAKIKEKADSNE